MSSSHNLNIEKINSGASNIWNIVKQKASQLHIPGSSESRICSNESKLILSDLALKTSTVFDPKNQEHIQLLQRFWRCVYPNHPFESNSVLWKQVGFQKSDPSQGDLKNSGLLALFTMINLSETYPERSKAMIEANKNNLKTNYPYAIVGINLTLLLIDVLRIRDSQ